MSETVWVGTLIDNRTFVEGRRIILLGYTRYVRAKNKEQAAKRYLKELGLEKDKLDGFRQSGAIIEIGKFYLFSIEETMRIEEPSIPVMPAIRKLELD